MAEKKNDRGKMFNFNFSKTRGTPSAECVRTLIVLKQQEHIIEKSLNALIANMKISSEISKDIQCEQVKYSKGRSKLFDSLKNTLYDIADELRFIKSMIKNISEIDVDKYRNKLESLWKRMDEFNKSNILETLVQEQSQLYLELSAFNEQLYKYEKNKVEISRHPIVHFNRTKSNNELFIDHKIVKDFDSLVVRTGHTQRWSDEDHMLFLKLRQKCKTVAALVTALQNKCPDLSTENIINHEAWYKIYLELKQKQKQQIREWRKMKQTQKKIEKQIQEKSSEDSEDVTCSDNSKTQNKFAEKSLKKAVELNILRRSKIYNENENETKKQLIKEWKEERENQRLQEEMELHAKMIARQIEQERQRQERTYRMKIELMEYKNKKLMEAEQKTINQTKQIHKIKQQNKYIQMFRQQDQRFIQKRRLLIHKKNTMNNQKFVNNVPNIKKRFSRNAFRQNFLKTTKGWEQKCTFFDPTQKRTPRLTYIKDLPRLRTFDRRNMESF